MEFYQTPLAPESKKERNWEEEEQTINPKIEWKIDPGENGESAS